VKNLLSKKPKHTGQVLASIGYSRGIAKTPSMVTESIGFKVALQESSLLDALKAQGIDSAKIAKKIDVLLEARKIDGDTDYQAVNNGLKHATAIYGLISPTGEGTKNTYNFIFSSDVQKKVADINLSIKEALINGNTKEN